ncbi:sulfatase [Pseudalgibacter alginicilyticus]|uniref:Sulfatase n=1 Tax=Pseudalgibacter alginicilyticus TaxID=1736674 RepID=A0A0P0D997_9FLAO|nr:sulfatase-like hydrolase/transferase [Pseudalgibacter alginicilyticus]ALJ05395.1 sulfatase [Pseudalgibacter alginicilyticus]
MKVYTLNLLFSFALLFSCLVNAQSDNKQPNIILIYADDLGKGLLSHYGQKIISTPHIDQLAEEGITFENAYSGMVCAPSRASLISGLRDCRPENFQITKGGIYNKISNGTYSNEEIQSKINSVLSSVSKNNVFLGEVAQKQGYVTGQFGKLEWGFAATHQQMVRHGWDEYYGYLDHVRAHGFYPPFLFRNGEVENIEGNTHADGAKTKENETPEKFKERWNMEGKMVYSQHLFMSNVMQFISKNRDNPFFLYFPTQLPHGPVSVPAVHPDFANNGQLTQIEKEYASMVKMLDDNVGQIMAHIKNLGIDENTLVIFTSDNGHEIYYTQEGRVYKPYRNIETGERFDDLNAKFYSNLGGDVFNGNGGRAGLKRSNLQGGIQAPLIARWPKKITKGQTSHLLVANYDFVATIADITGYKGTVKSDGLSFYKELIGEGNNKEHDYVVYASFIGPTIITKEGWKLRTHLSKNAFELFYLPDDYREENDLSIRYPKKVKELKEQMLLACGGDFENGVFTFGKNSIDVEKQWKLKNTNHK